MELQRSLSFEEFAEAEMARLLGLARVLTGNDHDAWDLTQDCLIRVGSRWSHVDADGNPGAYARTAMVRLNLNRLRRLRREWLTSDPPETRVAAEVDAVGDAAWLDAVLGTLPARQRTAIALRYLQDMSLAQIAEAMSCSTGTVKSQLSRGLQRLREHPSAWESGRAHHDDARPVRGWQQ